MIQTSAGRPRRPRYGLGMATNRVVQGRPAGGGRGAAGALGELSQRGDDRAPRRRCVGLEQSRVVAYDGTAEASVAAFPFRRGDDLLGPPVALRARPTDEAVPRHPRDDP